MGYRVIGRNDGFGSRKGLEGPFHYPNGRVLYYDPKQGEYYDPRTDWYVDREDVADLQQSIFAVVSAH